MLPVLCEVNLCKLCLPEGPEDNYGKTVSVKIAKAAEENYCERYLLLMHRVATNCIPVHEITDKEGSDFPDDVAHRLQ